MAGRKKKLPWNHGLKMPGLLGEPPSPEPKPLPTGSGPTGLTTGQMVPGESQWECLRCEQLRDGLDPLVPDHSPRCPYRGTGRDPERKG